MFKKLTSSNHSLIQQPTSHYPIIGQKGLQSTNSFELENDSQVERKKLRTRSTFNRYLTNPHLGSSKIKTWLVRKITW